MIRLPFEQPEVAILTKRSNASKIVWLITPVDNQAFVNTELETGRLIFGSLRMAGSWPGSTGSSLWTQPKSVVTE